jgi:hypothetical protein
VPGVQTGRGVAVVCHELLGREPGTGCEFVGQPMPEAPAARDARLRVVVRPQAALPDPARGRQRPFDRLRPRPELLNRIPARAGRMGEPTAMPMDVPQGRSLDPAAGGVSHGRERREFATAAEAVAVRHIERGGGGMGGHGADLAPIRK